MAKELTELEKHYYKFNEEKRLGRRHGQVEYRITMEYIHRYLQETKHPKILDVGAGTGRYSVALPGKTIHSERGDSGSVSCGSRCDEPRG